MKVLIVSHNPVSANQNMGKTILTLFSAFRREELCQLYIYPSIPDADACVSFYRITDKDVLKSYYKLHVDGREIEGAPGKGVIFENPSDQKIYRHKNNHAPWKCILRDAMWKCAGWYNRELRDWLDEQRPTCIFVAPGRAKFLYDMAMCLAGELSVPIVTYLCDDFYFTRPAATLTGRLFQYLLRGKIDALMRQAKKCITVCDAIKDCYARCFSIPFQTIMTASSHSIAQEIKNVRHTTEITYMGNIRCGRYKSLAQIGQELDEINEENGTSYHLKIYSDEQNQDVLKAFEGIEAIQLCGFVTGEEFERVFQSADILVHVESFAPEDIDRVRYSVSTKIADSLASGICLLAYGPIEVASIEYIKKEQCGVVCTEQCKLHDTLLKVLDSRECREAAAKNGLRVAARNHDPEKNQRLVKDIFYEVERAR